MWKTLIRTGDDSGALIARLALGIVMFPHGAQKLLGWYGGHGFSGTMGYFTETLGLPAAIACLVIVAEFFGSIGLVVGFLGRGAAFGIGCVMAGAVYTTHLPRGFFMNWAGTAQGEGYEYHLLALGLVLIVIVKGSGAFSIDRSLGRRG